MKVHYRVLLSTGVTMGLLLTACSHTTMPAISPNVDKTFPPAPAASGMSDAHNPPTAVTEALVPDFNPMLLNDRPADTRAPFNISVHDIDAREFFMSLVIDSDDNMVVHPDVTGTISLELKNVTVPQVLSAVQKVYGYDYGKTDIGYIIYPATLQTKVFKVDRIDLRREGSSNTRVTSGQLNYGQRNQGGNQGGYGGGFGGGNSGGQGSQNYFSNSPTSNNPNNSTSGTWINTSSRTDFWQELEQSLAAIVDADPNLQRMGNPQASLTQLAAGLAPEAMPGSAAELGNSKTGSRVVINKQTGIVVVRANPSQMREVETLIESTQNQIARQVVIEAKILEIILDDKHQDGVNWASVVREGGKAFLTASNPLPSAVNGVLTLSATSGDFSAFVSLMEGQGKTNILSSPRISTLNNQKAVIKVGEDEYFITDVSSTNNAINNGGFGANNTVSQDVTWTPFFSGIALDVTPQISDDKDITLHIHPSITRVQKDEKEFQVNGEKGSIPLAKSTVRESDSIVHAQSGQIIVIGGLMQEDRDENKAGVSLLSTIPYLGNAFRENTGSGKKSELVILLKPTVIGQDSDWRTPIEESRQRMQQLEKKQLWK